jgi:hypothetical protein
MGVSYFCGWVGGDSGCDVMIFVSQDMTSFAETRRELTTPNCCLVMITHMTALQVAVHCKTGLPGLAIVLFS